MVVEGLGRVAGPGADVSAPVTLAGEGVEEASRTRVVAGGEILTAGVAPVFVPCNVAPRWNEGMTTSCEGSRAGTAGVDATGGSAA
jgi:hypothetical protein